MSTRSSVVLSRNFHIYRQLIDTQEPCRYFFTLETGGPPDPISGEGQELVGGKEELERLASGIAEYLGHGPLIAASPDLLRCAKLSREALASFIPLAKLATDKPLAAQIEEMVKTIDLVIAKAEGRSA